MVSGVDPKRTFLTLCDADHLPPEFLWRMKHYRSRGTLAKVNLALSALPAFTGATREMLAAACGSRRISITSSARSITRSTDASRPQPWIEFTIPSLDDPALAPPGAHVLSAYVQFAPYQLARQADWDRRARRARRRRRQDARRSTRPDLGSLIVERQVITPLDLERGWGLTGGHIFHGELSLDQFFTMRPLLGFGQYRTPIQGPVSVRLGFASRHGLTADRG